MSAAELLEHLRRARLMDEAALARLAAGWRADAPAGPCAEQLVRAVADEVSGRAE